MKKNRPLILMLALMSFAAVYLTGCENGSSDNDVQTDDGVLEDEPVTNSVDNTAIYTTSHDNLVIFNYDPPLMKVTYTFSGEYCITSDQPWHGITTVDMGASYVVDANAGRKKSNGPAQWFKDHATAAIGVDTISPWPKTLNFAFNGGITIDGNMYQLVVGQGNDGVRNNWWIGGNQWLNASPNLLVTPDMKYFIIADERAANTFIVMSNSAN